MSRRNHINQLKRYIEKKQKRLAELEEQEKVYLESCTTTCPTCDGKGMERRMDGAGSMSDEECLTCMGIGAIGPVKCQRCGETIGTEMIGVRRNSMHPCPFCGGYVSFY